MPGRTIIWIFIIYILIAQCCAVYYMYEFAQTHGFWATLILGPILSELKGLTWILMYTIHN